MEKGNNESHALIYNRVSSHQQETEGAGLESQEQRCIKYAQDRGYIIDSGLVFHDTYTGGGDFMRRPAMRELLNYIDSNPGRSYVVIFDDLKRFARDTKFHIELRSAFNVRHVKVECLNFNFEDTPEGKFVETILAAQNQLEREQNQRQVIQKQKARLESGYWSFVSPLGYTMQKIAGFSGKIAVKNDNALILREALEGYASFRFIHFIDVARFLKDNGLLGQARADRYIDTIHDILRNPFYAGYVEYLPWNVSRRKGVHAALIDESTYRKNLERLNKPMEIRRVRNDDNEEFEVRRLINCIHCKRPFTACFSKGRSKRYPYYLCQTRGCVMFKKSISRSALHEDFKHILNDLRPTGKVLEIFEETFEEYWKESTYDHNKNIATLSDDIQKLEEDIERYLELAYLAKSETVRLRYEKKLEEIESELTQLKEKNSASIDFSIPYRTALEKVSETAKNPYASWTLSKLEEKKKLFYFFFDRNIEYDLKSRYRTVIPSVLYRFLFDLSKNSLDVNIPRNLSNQFTTLWKFIHDWNKATEVFPPSKTSYRHAA